MELPIAPQTYQPPADALVRAVYRAQAILARALAEETQLDAGTIYVNPQRRAVAEANFVMDLRVPAGASGDEALQQVLAPFETAGVRCAWLDAAGNPWPTELAEAAQRRGYRAVPWHVYALRSARPIESSKPKPANPGVNPGVQIIPARAVYGPLRAFFERIASGQGAADPGAIAAARIDELDESRLELFAARLDGAIAGVCGVVTLGQIGVLRQAETDPSLGGRGVGGALLAAVLEHCRRSLFEQVVIARHEGCPSIPFYEKHGFARAAGFVRWAG